MASALPSSADVSTYIRQAALARGIDPNVALRVAQSEGLQPGTWQSNVYRNGQREPSYGPFQLNANGGLGSQFKAQTGLDPSDPANWQPGVDFALDQAKSGGWGPWMGAKKAGITGMTGIDTSAPMTVAPTDTETKVASNDNSSPSGILGGRRSGGGLLGGALDGNDWRSSIGPMLMALGGGIAGGATQGWGAGIGQGLAGAGQVQANMLERAMKLAELKQSIGYQNAELQLSTKASDRAATEANRLPPELAGTINTVNSVANAWKPAVDTLLTPGAYSPIAGSAGYGAYNQADTTVKGVIDAAAAAKGVNPETLYPQYRPGPFDSSALKRQKLTALSGYMKTTKSTIAQGRDLGDQLNAFDSFDYLPPAAAQTPPADSGRGPRAPTSANTTTVPMTAAPSTLHVNPQTGEKIYYDPAKGWVPYNG